MNYTKPMFCFFPFGTLGQEFLPFAGFESGAPIIAPPIPAEVFKLFFEGKTVVLDKKHVIVMHANFHLIEHIQSYPSIMATMISAVYSNTATIWFLGIEKNLQKIFNMLALRCPQNELYVHTPEQRDSVYLIVKNHGKFSLSNPLPPEALFGLQ